MGPSTARSSATGVIDGVMRPDARTICTSRAAAGEGRKIESLEAKIQQTNEVLAERMGEHVALKKTLGQL